MALKDYLLYVFGAVIICLLIFIIGLLIGNGLGTFSFLNHANPTITINPTSMPEQQSFIVTTPVPTLIPQTTQEGLCSVTGRVYDANHKAIPNAKVTIFHTKFNMDYVATNPVQTIDNPQYTSDGSKSLIGLYRFSSLNPDVYIITVEKDGIAYSNTVQVQEGAATTDITIPGYIEKS